VKETAKADLVRFLRRHGVTKVRESGSHEVWRVGRCQTAVSKHRTIAAGTLRKVRDHLAPCFGEDWLKR
jgi:predicted RNA binding protein YcfA (HicA-like mRNA interferase family)